MGSKTTSINKLLDIKGGSVRESDHRIANNLSMISGLLRLRARDLRHRQEPIEGEEIGLVIEEAVSRIEAVAMLHRSLSLDPDRGAVDLDHYLFTVCDAVISSLASGSKVEPVYRLSSRQLVLPQLAVSVGLIVTELLTNSIKYAHPTGIDGKVIITSTLDAGRVVIEINDDGVGLPEGHDPTANGTLGFRLVHSMAAKFGAAVEFHSSELGLRIRLLLPEAGCRRAGAESEDLAQTGAGDGP